VAFKQLGSAALIGAILALGGSALPALAAKKPHVMSVITAPSAGASVSSPVTVSYSLSGGDADAVPPSAGDAPPPPSGGSWPAPTSSASPAGHHRLPQAFLVIDSPTPAAGSSVLADDDHVAFPPGQFQLSIPLSTGQHELQVVFVNHKGTVTHHFEPSETVSISVH